MMRAILLVLGVIFATLAHAQQPAPIQIQNLGPATTPLNSSDLMIVSQAGIARKTTVAAVAATGTQPAGLNGQIQYNNAGAFGGFTCCTGDFTITPSTGAGTLATVLGSPGTYTSLTVNAKGLVTAGTNPGFITGNQTITVSGSCSGSGTTSIVLTCSGTGVTSFNTRTGAVTLAAADVGGVISVAPITHQFLTGLNSSGVWSQAQPAASDISGLGALATLGVGTGLVSSGGNANVSYGTSAGTALQGNATVTGGCAVQFSSNDTVAAGTFPLCNPPWASGGTLTKVLVYTNGTGSPSFSVAATINGSAVTGCSAITVNSSAPSTTSCSGGTFNQYDTLAVTISSVSGTPTQALVQAIYTHKVE